MNSTRWLWRTAGATSALALIVLLIGLVYAVYEIAVPRPSAAPPEAAADRPADAERGTGLANITGGSGPIRIAALGDSLTRGVGDPTGDGYVGRLRQKLADASNRDVHILSNLAVSGYRTDQLLADLDKPAVADALRQADLIMFTIGGNDLFQSALAGLDFMNAPLTSEATLSMIPEPAERLAHILERLQTIHPDALIVYIGLFNPFLDVDESRATSLAIAEWNALAYTAVHANPNAIMAPVSDLFELRLDERLSSDHFHPNAEGYEQIAARLLQALPQ